MGGLPGAAWGCVSHKKVDLHSYSNQLECKFSILNWVYMVWFLIVFSKPVKKASASKPDTDI